MPKREKRRQEYPLELPRYDILLCGRPWLIKDVYGLICSEMELFLGIWLERCGNVLGNGEMVLFFYFVLCSIFVSFGIIRASILRAWSEETPD